MSVKLNGKRFAILSANGFEQSEREVPRDRLSEAGAEVHVASPKAGEGLFHREPIVPSDVISA